jgi:tRNA uridine 5-carbamoylmethylation protein Kti12
MKILIFGLPNYGKTTFAKKLVDGKKIPHFNAYDFFPVGIYKEKDGVNRYLSEDYYFCRLAEECGFEIWTDVSTPITHLGSTEYHSCFSTQLNKK